MATDAGQQPEDSSPPMASKQPPASGPRGAYGWFVGGVAAWFLATGIHQVILSWLLVGELGFVPTWLRTAAARASWLGPLLAPEFRERFADRDVYRQFLNRMDVAGQLKAREPVNQSLYLWSKAMLPDVLLNMLGDRTEMAHSIEGRTPCLDHDLVERVNSMPVHMKLQGITEKYVLREAARPYLTDTVCKRQKHPCVSPPALGGRFLQFLQDTLRTPSFASVPFFDAKAMTTLLDRLPQISEDEARFRTSWSSLYGLSAHVLHTRYAQ